MDPTPVYGARAEKPPKNADFAMKQTNICCLSGDIISQQHGQIQLLLVLTMVLPKVSSWQVNETWLQCFCLHYAKNVM